MATIYGGLVDAGAYGYPSLGWEAYGAYTVTETATAVTVALTEAGFRSHGWGFDLSSGVTARASLTGQASASGSGGFASGTGSYVQRSYVSKTWTVQKGTSAQALTLEVAVTNASGYLDGTSAATAVVQVPALASYPVTYSANGGSGAPGAQTKYHGQALKLSQTRPTRAGHTFKGWATGASGAVAYQPGATYSANAALALYAVWQDDYAPPTISGLSAHRCGPDGAAADGGTHVKVECAWAVGKGGNRATSVKVDYKLSSASSWTSAHSANPNAASGKLSVVAGGGKLAADSVYDVRVTVADAGGSSSAQVRVPGQFHPLDFGRQGRSVGIWCAASDSQDGLDVACAARFAGALAHRGRPVMGLAASVAGNDASFGGDTSKRWRRVASCAITSSNTDRDAVFLVVPAFGDAATQQMGAAFGVLYAHVRTGSGLASVQKAELVWEYAGWGVNPAAYVLCHRLTPGSRLDVEVWASNTNDWSCPSFQLLSEGDRTHRYAPGEYWTAHASSAGGSGSAAPPSGWAQVPSKAFVGGAPLVESGGWRYRRHADGTCDMWYRASHTLNLTGPSNGAYGGSVRIAYPLALASVEEVGCNLECAACVWSTFRSVTLKDIEVLACVMSAWSGAQVTLDIHVRGRWR